VACWQTDAQWTDREVREQLDALFAHRVYFATASTRDARAAVALTMAEFSDTVRPGLGHLSALGRPDVRLHLPKHHAIASWSTPEGRQAPFIAQTIPLQIDEERLAAHAMLQRERGGCHRTDLRQPHWDRRRPGPQNGRTDTPGPGNPESRRPSVAEDTTASLPATTWDRTASLPATPSDSYRELVELDGAQSVRWAKRVESRRALEPDPLDLEILALVAGLRHVLSSQVHRRFNSQRAATTTQRRLKRLSDAGLVERFQFHRRDGGGVPMCYVITAAGLGLLRSDERLRAPADGPASAGAHSAAPLRESEGQLRQARHDVHVVGWALAVERAVGGALLTLRGSEESVLAPPLRSTPDGKVALGPGDLRLPGGRAAHDFLRTEGAGERVEVERFETVRPDGIVTLPGGADPRFADGGDGLRTVAATEFSTSADTGAARPRTPAIDLIVELDDRLPVGRGAGKLERYDHFLSGWSVHTSRYGRRTEAVPVVVFVCRDRARARELARRADAVLRACRAYAGEYPFDWEYPGRERILFVSERDVHEGLLRAYGVPRLPPEVRVTVARGDPRSGQAAIEQTEIPGGVPRARG
jgi:hypothetical protein